MPHGKSLIRAGALGGLFVLALVGCGASSSSSASSASSSSKHSSSSSSSSSTSFSSSPASGAPVTIKGTTDSLDIALSGGHTATLTQFDTPLDCEADFRENDRVYDVDYKTPIDGLEFQVLVNESGPGTYDITDENVAVDGPDDSPLHWSSLDGATGTLTINPDLSGSIDGQISSRGGSLPGDGSKLDVKGTWSCATYRHLLD